MAPIKKLFSSGPPLIFQLVPRASKLLPTVFIINNDDYVGEGNF